MAPFSILNKSNYNLLYLLSGTAVLVYILIRAATIPVNYDESYTIRTFVPMDIDEILRFEKPSANNHLLNTFLIKFFYAIGPDSLFTARLPNVFAGLFYMVFAFKISRKYLSGFLGFSCFFLLVINPFLLDFFSVARGYGLAFGFLLASCYFIVKYITEKDQSAGVKSLLFGAFAVLSCFSLLNFWLISLGFFTLMPFIQKNHFPQEKQLIYYFLIFLGLLAIVWEPIRKTTEAKQLYYGGTTGIYSDTFVSIAKYSAYSRIATPAVTFWLNCFLFVFVLMVLSSFYIERKLISVKNVFLAMFLLCLFAVTVQYLVLQTPYIIDRTALYLYPLAILVISFSLSPWKNIRIVNLVSAGFILAFGLNFFLHANFSKQALWFYDSHTPEILSELNEKGKKENKVLLVGYGNIFISSLEYYFLQNNYPNLRLVYDDELSDVKRHDYHIHLSAPLDVVYNPESDPVYHYGKKTVFRSYPEDDVIIYAISK